MSHHIGSSSLSPSLHPHVTHDVLLSLILFDLSLYFNLSFPVFFLSSVLMFPDLQTDLYDPDSVQNDLRHSAKGSLVTYDDTHSLTGYEPNDTELNNTASDELVYSQGPLACVTPSSDQDIDDATLGKLLTEAHREYADYLSLEDVFVSQSSVSVASNRKGKPVGKSNIDPFSFGVRNAYSAQNQLPVITQAKRMVDRTVKPVEEMIAEERESSSAQMRTLLDEQRENDYRRMLRESFSSRTPKQLEQKKNVKFYKKNYGVSKWIFVKFINKVLLRWRNYENSRVLPSIRTRSSSRTRTQ